MAVLKVYNGSSWDVGHWKTRLSSSWGGVAHMWDGSAWIALTKLVQLVGGTFGATSISPANAVAQYRLLSSGSEQRNTTGSWFTLGTWLLHGAAGDYEVRYSPTGDTGAMGGAAINTWLSLSSSRTWSITDTTTTGGPESVSGPVEIRLASGGTVLASATVTLSANKDI